MTIKRAVPVDGQFVPNAVSTLLTPGTGITRLRIDSVTMYANVAVENVELFIVPDGEIQSTKNRTMRKAFAANEIFTAPQLVGQGIEEGGSLQGSDGGNGGTNVNLILTVTEFSGDS